MTKNAQQALKYLLQKYPDNVRFCLICNYISRIDESLQNEFMRCRFNKLPINEVYSYLDRIIINENLNIEKEKLKIIINNFNNDLRSIINYIQCNQNSLNEKDLIDENFWEEITNCIKNKKFDEIKKFLQHLSFKYQYEQKNILKDYINYLIIKKKLISNDFLLFVENAYHNLDINTTAYCDYVLIRLMEFI